MSHGHPQAGNFMLVNAVMVTEWSLVLKMLIRNGAICCKAIHSDGSQTPGRVETKRLCFVREALVPAAGLEFLGEREDLQESEIRSHSIYFFLAGCSKVKKLF